MNFDTFQRRILLFVTGLSPQIITETLYSLAIAENPHFMPTEIHLITTAEGARHALLTLLDREQGKYWQLCREYGLDANAIRFDETTMHVIKNDTGLDLNDIRTGEDNEAAADTITAVVRDLTADSQSIVHASIAGGRKTMGFFLGYAMSLFGRPQDRLSHVLVAARRAQPRNGPRTREALSDCRGRATPTIPLYAWLEAGSNSLWRRW